MARFMVRAITLDLDDTLWPFAPISTRIEDAMDAFFREHSPRTAQMYPIERMRELRARTYAEHPELAHDVEALRELTFTRALADSGGDARLLDAACAAFHCARNSVEFYPDALAALSRLRARVPVAAITNGNASLERIGLGHLFAFTLRAGEYGAAKPDPGIFHAACARLGFAPEEVLHVGDDVDTDVSGAARAGLRSCWLNREGNAGGPAHWPYPELRPDLEFPTLTGLADWLDTQITAPAANSPSPT